MTLVTKTCKPSNTTDADFRAFVTAVRTGFTDLGWVRTSDTGQIDPTTVLKPAAVSTVQGYDVFRMGDALQATAPFFVKVEYGSGTVASYHAVWVTVGTATNGAGTLSGNTTLRVQLAVTVSDANTRNCLFAGGANRISVTLFESAAAANTVRSFVIERSHADDGTDTGERADFVYITGGGSPGYAMLPSAAGATIPPAESILPILTPGPGSTGTRGTEVGVYPVFPNQAGPLRNPMVGLLIYLAGEIATLQDIPVTMYGVARTYRTHAEFLGSNYSMAVNTTAALMVLVS